MSLIPISSYEDEFHRNCVIYVDTDDLTQEQYYEYCKLLRESKKSEAHNFLKRIKF